MKKILLAQLSSSVGDFENNKNKALSALEKAQKEDIDLVIFPELFLSGANFGDLFNRFPKIINSQNEALNEIIKNVKNNALVGFVKEENGKYYNSVAFIQNQKLVKTFEKSILENKAEKLEARAFEAKKTNADERIIELNNKKIGIVFENENIEFEKIDYLVVFAYSITRGNKEYFKHQKLSKIAREKNIKLIYINQTGANDEYIYEGASRAYGEQGEICALAKMFDEEILVLEDFKGKITPILEGLHEKPAENFDLNYENDLSRTYHALICSIKNYFKKHGLKRAVLGLSGGLDSTICATILADALGANNVLGISMPSKLTSSESKNDAKELAQNLGINFIEIPIKETYDLTLNNLNQIFDEIKLEKYSQTFTKDNIQARSRATILWCASNEYASMIPIATSDKSELYMGYATTNGDMTGGYAPIMDVCKTKLFALARWLNKNREIKNAIPENIILKPPGAELALDPKTGKTLIAEDALMPYEFLDEVIWRIENLHQSTNDMMKETFLYEKKNNITDIQKLEWLDKFFKRMNSAAFKLYITPLAPMIDNCSINKRDYHMPITSKIIY